jgi:preprotein translocase subunit SecD
VRHAWRALTGLLAIVVVLFGVNALGVYAFGKSSWTPELALDLQGGTQIILEAKTPDGAAPTTEQMNQAARSSASAWMRRVSARPTSRRRRQPDRRADPGPADEETRKRIEPPRRCSCAVLYTTAASTSFVGEDGNQTPYPTPDPSLATPPDGIADQRQRPQLVTPALQAEFLAYDCSNKANDPANAPRISR